MRDSLLNIIDERELPLMGIERNTLSGKVNKEKSKYSAFTQFTSAIIFISLVISNIGKKYATIATICAGAWIVHDKPLLFLGSSFILLFLMLCSLTTESVNGDIMKIAVSVMLSTFLIIESPWVGLITLSYPIATAKDAYNMWKVEQKLKNEVIAATKAVNDECNDIQDEIKQVSSFFHEKED